MNLPIDLKLLKPGDRLPVLTRRIAQERINEYADASGDHNPIHLDPAFARQTALGGTVAHGMLVLAYVSEHLTGLFRDRWTRGGRLTARFKDAARPGDTVTVSGTVTRLEGNKLTCDVQVRNQQGEPVILCEATVEV